MYGQDENSLTGFYHEKSFDKQVFSFLIVELIVQLLLLY